MCCGVSHAISRIRHFGFVKRAVLFERTCSRFCVPAKCERSHSAPRTWRAPAPTEFAPAHDDRHRRSDRSRPVLGSSVTIELAGPGIIISYLIGALVAVVMAYALAEMAVVHPVAGSFGIYAETYLSPWAGFTVRATYGLVQIIAIGAEVTAVAIYFGFWFPSVPGWEWISPGLDRPCHNQCPASRQLWRV